MRERDVDLLVSIFAEGCLSTQTRAAFVRHALDMCKRSHIEEMAEVLYKLKRADVLLAIGQHFLSERRLGEAMECLCFVDDKPTLLRLAEEAKAQRLFSLVGGACALADDRKRFDEYFDETIEAPDHGPGAQLVSGAEAYLYVKWQHPPLAPSAPTPYLIDLLAQVLSHEMTEVRPPHESPHAGQPGHPSGCPFSAGDPGRRERDAARPRWCPTDAWPGLALPQYLRYSLKCGPFTTGTVQARQASRAWRRARGACLTLFRDSAAASPAPRGSRVHP